MMKGQHKLNGKPIVDATEPTIIRVSRRDLNGAKRKNPMSCAIARGACHSKCVVSARIGLHRALIEGKKEVKRYAITSETRKMILAFDNAGYFQPGEYKLVPFTKTIRAAAKKTRKHSGPQGKHLHLNAKAHPIRHMYRVEEK